VSNKQNDNDMNQQQVRPITQSGSFVNNLLGNNDSQPVVGELATVLLYSDRHVYEVTEVSEDGKTCKIRRMKARRSNGNDMSEMQSYSYQSMPGAPETTLVWRAGRNGATGYWAQLNQTVQFTKDIQQRAKELGAPFYHTLLTEEQKEQVYAGHYMPANVVEGITYLKKSYQRTSIIFGRADEYFDWSF
jgi:hypothetical protein